MNPSPSGALGGIRILDLTQALAGPYCTQILADFGAQVIKIERPGTGDQSRGWGPPFVEGESAYFMGTNRNKLSLTLDLRDPQAHAVLHKLVATADVLVHNVPKAATRRKLGIDAATIRRLQPRIIWASISGFGLTGPEAEKPGYDVIAQAMSGTMALTGEAGSNPTRFPSPMADITTGMYAAMGILTALFDRERSGEGQDIDVALLDAQLSWLSNIASSHLATGAAPAKRGNVHPNIAPYQPFHASDGWLILAAGTEPHWKRVLGVLEAHDLPDSDRAHATLASDPRFRSNADRVEHREAMQKLMEQVLQHETVATWIERFENAGVPCGPILAPEQALSHPHVKARGMIVELDHERAGKVRSLGNPIGLSRTPAEYRRAAPVLGADTEALLSELGLDAADIQALQQRAAQGSGSGPGPGAKGTS